MFSIDSDHNSGEMEYWDSKVYYNQLYGFAADSVFFVLVFLDTDKGEVVDVRCNCDSFDYPEKSAIEEKECLCSHSDHAYFLAQYQLDHGLRQSDSTEVLPVPEPLESIVD